LPDEVLLTEVDGPRGTAEIFEVTLEGETTSERVLEVEYAVVFGGVRNSVPSMGEAHLLANQLTGLDESR
jgi:hypothetical protein